MTDRAGPRELTDDERRKLACDVTFVTDFKQRQLEEEARRNWDLFYKRNETRFFKDRHWTGREFEELIGAGGERRKTLLEVGCGVGNLFYPLLEEGVDLFVHACDFSQRAVQFVKDHPLYDESRVHAFQCDVTRDKLDEHVTVDCIDIATLVFVLSSVHPDKMSTFLKNVHSVLKRDGVVLIRDYGLYDHAMLRFARGHKLQENFYVRQDGTRAYYFSVDKMKEVFTASGFVTVSCDYVHRETVNKKEGLCVPRVFVQGRFSKAK
ncbi:tRNA N(3)-methylcytidine methyltransferase METTL6-like [Corticium candelabrum]|uniref:tRNA N(3)-methylcytidine methyltransferase METTL6-like n=1 Tax=Corticium candelabrum TaxID=121492 RepID=UPI002E252513|nr:tRNA N(3)-methylcytidine methyltransferase METTL6-like [Corticium candelabrum]